ncbi:methylenetetrahydrofolate reductase [NAD(P)H] [Desulforhopalus sp. IMCC35007]|uniref:methylenetetrahydrofolate reductase [NAD(P)H] n=1 Tax=Desulforhopalus sp. IMCC35007 TaxID=2569543 RepID=UPI0010AE8224|nr:methylenetetrahydrofolate reductase [NAD(P)H] [Desulforhopalus sp. IMCC35007]TKB05914.1 methylenetetrahydrofolate reductase [NAD(P)H] [Desulforhopalus sp. IMCC35007]
MHISEIFNRNPIAYSYELFPPKSKEAAEQLFATISDLSPLELAYVSVTYGAGGSTRNLTHDLVVRIQEETDLPVVSHLTCVGSTRDEIKSILDTYSASGIDNILALRGDPPQGQGPFEPVDGGFRYAAELVEFIRKHQPQMGIGVAGFPEGHPETPNRLHEIDHLKAKVDAGADYICTQLFFDNNEFYDFCERCELAGIRVPIVAGIAPITSVKLLKRMAEVSAGTRFPARLIKAMQRAENEEHQAKVGIHWATEQVRDLIDHNTKGIHLYTLNKSNATRQIYDSLGVTTTRGLV